MKTFFIKNKNETKEENYEEEKTPEELSNANIMVMMVGGQRFQASRGLLRKFPETLLGKIANEDLETTLIEFPDDNPETFQHILDFYRTGGFLFESTSVFEWKKMVPIYYMYVRFGLANIDVDEFINKQWDGIMNKTQSAAKSGKYRVKKN